MINKLAVSTVAASALVVSLALACPAYAGTQAYYQQQVSGGSQGQCNASGDQVAAEKRAQGYLVTWTGCGYDSHSFRYVGVVAWSD